MKKVDIVYCFEHVARELDIACAVKFILKKRYGLSMEIISYEMDLETVPQRYRPDVVAVPYCYSAEDSGLRDVWPVWRNANYLNLAFEQIFGKANEVLKVPRDDFAKEHVLHHAWGDSHAALLREHGVPEGNIIINGNPSYTLYRPPYSSFYETRADLAERHGLDPSKRWVFVPENYGMAFYSDDVMQWITQQYVQRGFDEAMAYRYREFATASLAAAIHWWHQAAQLGSVELIVRPRPATPLQSFVAVYRATAGQTPEHLHIIQDGSVREWILASDVVMSSYSTTLIEAAVAGKPIHMLAPLPFPEFVQQDWHGLVPKIESADEFVGIVTAERLENTCQGLCDWAEDSMMSCGDAIVNLAGILASMRLRRRPLPEPPRACRLPANVRQGVPVWRQHVRRVHRALALAVRSKGAQQDSGRSDSESRDKISTLEIALHANRWARFLDTAPGYLEH